MERAGDPQEFTLADAPKPLSKPATGKPVDRELPVVETANSPVPTIVIEDAASGNRPVKATDHAGTTYPSPQNKGATSTPSLDKATPPPPDSENSTTMTGAPTTSEPVSIDDPDSVPGSLTSKKADDIPDGYYRVGWRQVAGIDDPRLNTPEAKGKYLLETFLRDQFYGEWYHNAGIVIFAVLTTHFITRFHLSISWLLVILSICTTYYTTSIVRFRRNARDDILRELVKTRLASEHESAEWLNNFLDRFWRIYEPVLSTTIKSTVDQILSQNTPAFLDSLRLSDLTFGNKAPRIDKVRTFPKTEDDIVMMDWGISFTPNDTSEMTEQQVKDKVNPKIALHIMVGKGLATAALPVLVEDISFQGFLRIRMKLMSNFPHAQVVDITFVEKPTIDFVLKPIGGDMFGFDIANLPGLSTFIREMTHATLGPMMYDPNVFTLNLEQMLSGKPLDAAIGVLEVVVRAARSIQGPKMPGGTIDPYVSLSINERVELARTRYKTNTTNPTWNETKYILIHNLNDQLILSIYDYNGHRKNTKIAFAMFELAGLIEDASQDDIISPLLKEGKNRGELRYDIRFYPVIEDEAGKQEVLDSTVGIVRLVLHQAKELDQSKSLSGDLNPFGKIYLNHNNTSSFQTLKVKHTTSPVWEAPFEFLCTDKVNAIITVKVVDDRDFLKDPVLGYMSIRLVDLIEKKTEARDWFPLSGCKQGKVRVSAEWKPIAMEGAVHGTGMYAPPIGVVRLVLEKATDVKNVEAMLGGKSDPYVRVQVENVTKGRTEVVNNNLNPVWDQIIYIPVHSLRETMMLECMDYQHLTRDRPLGSTELAISNLATPSEDLKYPYKSNGVKSFTSPLRQEQGGNVYKGTLHYTAEFVPALALRHVKFETSPETEVEKLKRSGVGKRRNNGGGGEDNDEDGGVVTDGSTSSDDDDVPPVVTIKNEKKRTYSLKKMGSSESVRDGSPSSAPSSPTVAEKNGNGNGNGKAGVTPAAPNANALPVPKKEEEKGVEMSTEELLAQQSGVIVFHIISGQLKRKARLEVLLDDGYWPCFSTMKARSHHAQWEYVGEGFVKEVDFSRVWLRLNEADDVDKDDIIAEWKGDAKMFLQNTLNGPQAFDLLDRDNEVNATVEIEARYVPVPVRLEARESINNQGILRIDLLDGREIRGVDRSGKSDPFAVFSLNGHKVFKSQTKKKTIAPEWNENFEVSVPSRVGADFSVELFDWNQIEQAKSLGVGTVDITSLEPFQSSEQTIKLSTSKHGEKGQIRIRLVFQPEIIAKSRKSTTTFSHQTFSSAGRTMTAIGGLPVSAGKGVFHGVAGVFKPKDNGNSIDDVIAAATISPSSAANPGVSPSVPTSAPLSAPAVVPVPLDGAVSAMSFPSSDNLATSQGVEVGTLRVTVVDGKDLGHSDSIKPYVTVRVGDKEVKTKHTQKSTSPEWNESFIFAASPLTTKVSIWVHDHKTIGKDKELGDAEVEIWHHLKTQGTSSADTIVELKQGGLVQLRLEFDSSAPPNGSRPSLDGDHAGRRNVSIPSPSRFNLRALRPSVDHDDS